MPEFTLKKTPSSNDRPHPPFLADVNEKQKEAVLHTDGPLLIIAGAGSGKTRVLTYRIANLLYQEKARPYQILSLTFTNKAAREMQERITDLIGEQAKKLWMGTFHSIFSRILRFEADKLGYTSDFSIYDTVDSDRVIKLILKEIGMNPREVKPQSIRFIISNAKNQVISPQEFKHKFASSTIEEIASRVYERYVIRLKQSNAMDFDDLLIKIIELFEQHPETLQKYQSYFQYILIDEYQDTNHAQYRAARLLADLHKNICVVGDDAQSIYSFRGADISNILNFKEDYPDAVHIPLEQNYRSTKSILRCADSVIKRNKAQLEKDLWTQNSQGDPVTLIENYDERDEANRVARMILEFKQRNHLSFNDFAVLYRTNYQSRVLEDAFRRRGLTYQLVGGISFYQRKEIKDVTAYLKLLVNPDDDESLLRIINEPSRGIGEKTLNDLISIAREEQLTVWRVLKKIDNYSIYKPAAARIREFVDIIERTVQKLGELSLSDTVRFLLDETGFVRQFIEEHSHDSLMRRQNVMELINAISYFEKSAATPTLSTFLQEISLVTDLDAHDSGKPAVTLMTVHGSKGLEFPVVFIVGLEEELFPIGGRSGEDVDIEEERRLFYVAITRAEKKLYFSYAKNRFRFGEQVEMNKSRFIDEVDPSVIRTETGASIQTKTPSSSGFRIAYDNKHSTSVKREPPIDPDLSIEYDESEQSGSYKPGVLVNHPSFGPGKVLQTEGSGQSEKVLVFFKNAGQKKLLVRLANLTIID